MTTQPTSDSWLDQPKVVALVEAVGDVLRWADEQDWPCACSPGATYACRGPNEPFEIEALREAVSRLTGIRR